MAKNRSADSGQKVPFVIAAVLLAAAVIGSIGMFIASVMLHEQTQGEFTKSVYPIKYEYYVESSAKEFGVDVCLIYGVIRTESNFDPDAVSQAGAIGLMQIMPETFTWLQNYRTEFMPDKLLDSNELYKPAVNIEYGTYMLRFLLDHYGGNTSLAICACNAGYGNVDNWLADGTIPRDGVTSDSIPFTETANYLDRVTTSMEMYRKLYYSEIELDINTDYTSSADDTEQASSEEDESIPEIEYEAESLQDDFTDVDGYIHDDGGEEPYYYDYDDLGEGY